MKKILLAGGTGFIGTHLIDYLRAEGYELSILARKKMPDKPHVEYFHWDLKRGVIDERAFEDVDTVINLTGANIFNERWTKSRKSEIINSRVVSMDLLYHYISKNKYPVKNYISPSAIGYYGAVTTDKVFTENSKNGDDFLAFVCQKWEKSAHQFQKLNCRVVVLRQGIVFGKDGGAFKEMTSLVKKRINPVVGDGKQYISWIDIRDLTRLYLFCLKNQTLSGVFNAVSSNQITMNDLGQKLQIFLGKKNILPNAPAFLIKLLFGDRSSMILEGSRTSNSKIKAAGFCFLYDNLEKSLE